MAGAVPTACSHISPSGNPQSRRLRKTSEQVSKPAEHVPKGRRKQRPPTLTGDDGREGRGCHALACRARLGRCCLVLWQARVPGPTLQISATFLSSCTLPQLRTCAAYTRATHRPLFQNGPAEHSPSLNLLAPGPFFSTTPMPCRCHRRRTRLAEVAPAVAAAWLQRLCMPGGGADRTTADPMERKQPAQARTGSSQD